MGWETIESAPHDATHIWLARPGSMRMGFWAAGDDYANHGTVGGGWIDLSMAEAGGIRGLRFAPTHWQPLPAPLDAPFSASPPVREFMRGLDE